MKSIGFGAYDNFSSVSSFQLNPHTRFGYAHQRAQEGFPVASIVFGLIFAAQLVAYIAKQSDMRGSFKWRWYDTVLLPSYLIFGIFKLFGGK